jgi:hypothetical protein
MIIKRNMAIDSLTKVCEESLNLIKQLIDADHAVYGKGFEDGMAAQAKVQQTLKPWVGLTDEEQLELYKKHSVDGWGVFYDAIEAKLKEKNGAKT